MRFRIFFLLVTLFFVTMNVLLWRSEFTEAGRVSSPVPAERVWEKILTAPDNSRLAITHQGRKIGHCTWAPNLQEPLATGKYLTETPLPEGMVKRLQGYTLDLDGNVTFAGDLRVRFNFQWKFGTNQAVAELAASVKTREETWEVRSVVAKQTLRIQHEADGQRSTRVYRLANPRHLERLLSDLGLPVLPGTLAALGLDPASHSFSPAMLGLNWRASQDWLQVGQARFRVYRLEVNLLGQHRARVFVSPIGEILRMELPDQLHLDNDALEGLPETSP